jgi:malate dehydrogenase (oxaloacetate-decarboxylating)
VTDEMILAAALAVAGEAQLTDAGSVLLPSNADLRSTSSVLAIAVAKAAADGGATGVELNDLVSTVKIASSAAVSSRTRAA